MTEDIHVIVLILLQVILIFVIVITQDQVIEGVKDRARRTDKCLNDYAHQNVFISRVFNLGELWLVV